jgi:hypothetical protein
MIAPLGACSPHPEKGFTPTKDLRFVASLETLALAASDMPIKRIPGRLSGK